MALAVVSAQLAGSLPARRFGRPLVVAYEPVWAIGTGLTPTLADIAEIHAGDPCLAAGRHAHPLRRLGQSRQRQGHPRACRMWMAALIGGASLKADDFWAIVEAAE